MKSPPRLIDASPSARTRSLLAAAGRDRPRASALPAVAAALGASLPASAAAVLASQAAAPAKVLAAGATAQASAGGVAAGAGTAGVASLAASSVLKVVAIGALVGGVSSTAYVVTTRPALIGFDRAPASVSSGLAPPSGVTPPARSHASSVRSEASRPVASESSKSSWTGGTAAPVGTAVGNDAPASPARANGAAARPLASAGPMGDSEGPLAQETRLIDQARAALARGNQAETARLLDTYDGQRRLGVLDREAAILRIELAVRAQRLTEAKALTIRFAARHPNDPRLEHLKKLIGE